MYGMKWPGFCRIRGNSYLPTRSAFDLNSGRGGDTEENIMDLNLSCWALVEKAREPFALTELH